MVRSGKVGPVTRKSLFYFILYDYSTKLDKTAKITEFLFGTSMKYDVICLRNSKNYLIHLEHHRGF